MLTYLKEITFAWVITINFCFSDQFILALFLAILGYHNYISKLKHQYVKKIFKINQTNINSHFSYREDMRNSFNFLLIALISMDSCFLFLCLLEGVRKIGYASNIQVLLFPHLLYPLISIVFTASIYMTVAIAIERYIAVHYPIDYSQVSQIKVY